MRFRENTFYFFGISIGIQNLWKHGFQLGLLKTLGKIIQPVNHYTRFPEYYYFEKVIRNLLTNRKGERIKILDIGSPKLFGLYLAYHYPFEVFLTDLSERNINEYIVLWGCIRKKAKGSIYFLKENAKKLAHPKGLFDGVYSMSVIEHIEGQNGDSRALKEILRVLKEDGIFVISVPFGNKYMEQEIKKSQSYLKDPDPTMNFVFFQRIYDQNTLNTKLPPLLSHSSYYKVLISRRLNSLLLVYSKLSTIPRGMVGFINPLLSQFCNYVDSNFTSPPSRYHQKHHMADIYSDVIISNAPLDS